MKFQDMPASQAVALRTSSLAAPLSDPDVDYPDWYMHRWHFLPEGYLSRRSAAGYDRVVRNVYNAFSEHRVARDVARRVRALRAESVLEVGSGPGRLLERLARIRSVRKLTGVELSPYLLERSAKLLRNRPVDLRHADGLALPVETGSYDIATASHFIGHIPESERRAATAEIARAVRPGGRVVIVDHRWHARPQAAALRLIEESNHAFGAIRLSVFERLSTGKGS